MQGSLLLRNLLNRYNQCEEGLVRGGLKEVIESMERCDPSLQVAASQLKICCKHHEW